MGLALSLEGRRIVVTGASHDSAIGRAIVLKLAEAGGELILVGRRTKPLEEMRAALDDPSRHVVAPFDLYDIDAIPRWLASLAPPLGIHGIVHSASFQGYSPVNTVSRKAFDQYFTVNVGAPLMLARGLRQRGVASEGAAMVFIGSVAGLRGQKGRSLYSASKAALVGLTKSLALELADRGIRVNCVAPAMVKGAQAEHQFSILSQEQAAALRTAHPLGLGEPEEVAHMVAFLLSDLAAWMTGTVVPVDGGFAAQ